jgi:hypothetical protein
MNTRENDNKPIGSSPYFAIMQQKKTLEEDNEPSLVLSFTTQEKYK